MSSPRPALLCFTRMIYESLKMRVAILLWVCLVTSAHCIAQEDVDKLLAASNPAIQKQLRDISRVLHPVDGLSKNGEAFRKMQKLKELAEDKVELVKQVAIFSM